MTEPSNIGSIPSPSGPQPTRRDVLVGSAAAAAGLMLPRVAMAATLSTTSAASGLGTAYPRRDGPLKVRGAARYAAEHRFPGMVYGALAFSTIARGRIRGIETEAARTAPGVVLIMTYENAPRMAAPEPFYASPTGMAGSAIPVMQDALIRWNGQPVAVILADTQEEADHAARLIRVDYDEKEAVTRFDDAAARAEISFYAGRNLEYRDGDAETALAQAAASVDLDFSTPQQNHNQIEPHAVTVAWQDGVLRMHDCTQGVDLSAITIAKVFGLDPSQVHLTAEFVGGGFGGKTLWQYHVLAAAAARLADRPVRMTLTREGVYRICGGRAPTHQRVALGAEADGRLTALIHTGTTMKIAENSMTEPFMEVAEHMYRTDSMHLEIRAGVRDMLANTFMRAPGAAVGTFPLEVALDALAERLGLDPIELRIRNEPERDPTTGKTFSQRGFVEALKEGARRFGWQTRLGERLGRREGEWLVGTGMAGAYYPYKRFPGGAGRITLRQDGSALLELAAHDMGMGTSTATAAVAAARLGLPYEAIEIRYGDNRLPGSMIAAASQQMAAISAALTALRDALIIELVALAPIGSPIHGQPAEALTLRNGALILASDPAVGVSVIDLVAETRVNAVTRELRVTRITGVYDCGRIINPTLAASQFRSGIVVALGMALMENTLFDERNGRIANPSLAAYYMPAHLDVPEIDVAWTDIPDPHAPSGARGIGEISMTGLSAAVANAVYDATGKRVPDLPITLDKLL
ncbi:MAG: xanthine dehydrogenase family protein molybdopterin-binding subunit [Pseudomonadota bacterium]